MKRYEFIKNSSTGFSEESISEEKVLAVGMTKKAKEFVTTGSEIYHGNLPDEAKEHH